VVYLDFEGSPREVGPYWLSPPSVLFILAGAGFSFEVFQLSSRPALMQASKKVDLPCPWAPLQSITAAASHRIPEPTRWGCNARGKIPFTSRCFASDGGT
jgi:hypothetical protein